MKRHKHGLSHYRLLTCDMGELIPIGVLDVLPGDTIQMSTSMLMRLSPLVAPVMHPVTVRVHHWFTPYRLLWDDWEDFITGGPDGTGAATAYPVATTTPTKGSLIDYLGVPVGASVTYSTLPLRAYNEIFNQHYRDQDLVAEVPQTSGGIQRIAWAKDAFTAARPWTQKGPDVTLPLGTSAPVIPSSATAGPAFRHGNSGPAYALQVLTGTPTDVMANVANSTGSNQNAQWSSSGLIADLANSTGVHVNDFRRAFALQRYQEARAQYGSRYTEYLRYLGVRPSDARLQRPEYLGGGKQTISFSEVLQTGPDPTAGTGVANMFGHGLAAMRSRRFRKFIPEHGVILTLLSVRPKSVYMDGLPRMWSKRTKEDYWQKELEFIGEQEVFNRELYVKGDATDDGIFGYNSRYYEYRHQPSQVAGDFRDTLDFWHIARGFTDTPTLNASFINCNPSKRIHAEQTADALWCMVQHSIQARRMVSKSTIGRII